MLSTRSLACLAAVLLPALPSSAATSVATVPSGYLTLSVAAGSGSGSTPTVLAFPLQGTATAAGQMAGLVSGVTASTITNSNAGWTAGELSQAATPYLLQFSSGLAAGRTFLLSTVTANSATTVTLDGTDAAGTDLTTLGIAAGDAYRLFPADTLLAVFGTPATTGVLGAAGSPAACDQLQILQASGWISYYYDTTAGHWLRVSSPHTTGDNLVIRPDTGVIYNRYASSPLTFTIAGGVPSVPRQAAVQNSGPTALSNSWPADLTLATSAIQALPGWTSGPSAATADTLLAYNAATGWRQYYYDGTNWRLSSPPYSVSDSVAFPAGGMVILNKLGAASGQAILTQVMPYSLAPTP